MIKETTKTIKRVGFFGDAEASSEEKHFKDAFKVAKLLAENGYVIVNGGGPGVMLASTLGAKEVGGRVELVILDQKKKPDNYEGIDKENLKLADKVTQVENYSDRLNKLVEVADAFVIFKGGTGTLSEVGLTWELAKFDYGHHEPLIFFGKFWKHIIKDLEVGLNLEDIEKGVVQVVTEPEDVLRILKKV